MRIDLTLFQHFGPGFEKHKQVYLRKKLRADPLTGEVRSMGRKDLILDKFSVWPKSYEF
jgi:hypothetical protein